MTSRPALTLAANGIRRGVRNRTVMLMGVVGPLVLGGVLALAFGGGAPQLRISLVDLDDSGASKEIVDGLEDAFGGGGAVVLDVDRSSTSVDEVRREVDEGDIGAAVVIPGGYGGSVTGASAVADDASPEPLVVVTSAGNPTSSAVAEGIADSITARTDLTRSVVRGLLDAGVDPTDTVSAGMEPVLASRAEDFSGDFDAPLFLGPLAVFLFLGLSVNAKSLVRDQQVGILDRIRSAPLSGWSIVAGSAAAVMVTGLLGASVVVVGSTLVFGASWGDPLDVAAVMVGFVASVAGLLGLVTGLASTEAQADSWTNLMAFGFAVIGGSFFGGALLPGVLGFIGSLTPNGASMVALLDAGPGRQGLAGVWHLVAWMFLIGVVGVIAGGVLLNRRLR